LKEIYFKREERRRQRRLERDMEIRMEIAEERGGVLVPGEGDNQEFTEPDKTNVVDMPDDEAEPADSPEQAEQLEIGAQLPGTE
jgi:hypothetical protein